MNFNSLLPLLLTLPLPLVGAEAGAGSPTEYNKGIFSLLHIIILCMHYTDLVLS